MIKRRFLVSRRQLLKGGLAVSTLACGTDLPSGNGAGEAPEDNEADAGGSVRSGGGRDAARPDEAGRDGAAMAENEKGSAADGQDAASPDTAAPAGDADLPRPDGAGDGSVDGPTDAGASPVLPAGAIIDAHTHFLYGGASSPAEFARMVRPLGVVGTVVIQATTSTEVNLKLAEDNPVILGYSGGHTLGSPGFKDQVRRHARNKFFRGVRSGGFAAAAAMSDLVLLADLDLALDVLIRVDQIPSVVEVARRVPGLRIVINHVANYAYRGGKPSSDFIAKMESAARQPNIYCKVSSLAPRSSGGSTFFRPLLDELWRIFGDDHLIWASNWPVPRNYAAELAITRQYLADKPKEKAEKFYGRNALAVYKWSRR
jgi:L-fuconolactonase